MDDVVRGLLWMHVGAGAVALGAAALAMATVKGSPRHRQVGTVYFAAMLTVAVTAIPVTWFRPNPFLFCVALFSFYLAFSGFRSGRRNHRPSSIDRAAAGAMLLSAVVMVAVGVRLLGAGVPVGWVLLVFAALGVQSAVLDLKSMRTDEPHVARVNRHLRRMLGATIAATTAVLVQQLASRVSGGGLQVAVWLAPTVLGLPVIELWSRAVLRTGKYRLSR